MIDVSMFLAEMYPNDHWSVEGVPQNEAEYKRQVTWNSDNKQPTWEEIEVSWGLVNYKAEYRKVQELRQLAYSTEADPIYFQWQRNNGKTQQDWLGAIAAIEERFPYPPEPAS